MSVHYRNQRFTPVLRTTSTSLGKTSPCYDLLIVQTEDRMLYYIKFRYMTDLQKDTPPLDSLNGFTLL